MPGFTSHKNVFIVEDSVASCQTKLPAHGGVFAYNRQYVDLRFTVENVYFMYSHSRLQ